ncbi:MAG: hypothetical protein Q7S57_00165 [bacterium]|nr:hypothetical protein [bacterium]
MNSLIKIPSAFAQGLSKPPSVGLPEVELPALLLQLVNYALGLVGVLALGFIVYGGFLYITAHGDDKQVTSAKGIIINAIIGIIVIGLAAALVNFIVKSMTGG